MDLKTEQGLTTTIREDNTQSVEIKMMKKNSEGRVLIGVAGTLVTLMEAWLPEGERENAALALYMDMRNEIAKQS